MCVARPLAQPPWLLRFPHLASLGDEFPPVFNEIVHNRYDAKTPGSEPGSEPTDELRSRYHSTVTNNSAIALACGEKNV